jgi:hypothetical protein
VYTKIPEDKRGTQERKQKGLEAQKGISIKQGHEKVKIYKYNFIVSKEIRDEGKTK